MKAVLIGLGMVANTHLAAIHASTHVQLHGVMGRNPEKARGFASLAEDKLGAPVKLYSNIAEIAADPQVEFAIIATPPDARQNYVDALSRAKIPILMEKPIERTLDAAIEIVQICQSRNVPLAVVLQHRARAASAALKHAIESEQLGEIATVELRVPWWREQSYYDTEGRGTYTRDGGGVMITQAIHTLDLMTWLLGPARRIQALMRKTPLHDLEAEDWAGAVFELQSGAVGSLMATTAAFPGQSESLAIQGSKGAALLTEGSLKIEFLNGHSETHGGLAKTGSGADPMAFTHDWHTAIIENFAHTIGTGGTPLASGQSALMAQAIIDAMQQSNTEKRQVEVRAV